MQVPVPEPSFALALVFGVLALVMIGTLRKR